MLYNGDSIRATRTGGGGLSPSKMLDPLDFDMGRSGVFFAIFKIKCHFPSFLPHPTSTAPVALNRMNVNVAKLKHSTHPARAHARTTGHTLQLPHALHLVVNLLVCYLCLFIYCCVYSQTPYYIVTHLRR